MMSPAALARRAELSHLARKSRVKWVLECKEEVAKLTLTEPVEPINPLLPGTSNCIQSVFTFLSDIVNDGETFDIQAILNGAPGDDEDDVDETTLVAANIDVDGGSGDSSFTFNHTLKKLLHSDASDLVKTLQYFVCRFAKAYEETGPSDITSSNSNSSNSSNSNSNSNSKSGTSKGYLPPDLMATIPIMGKEVITW